MAATVHDPLDQLRRSFAAVAALISAIRPDQWPAPTPCEQWDVRRVVEHIIEMNLVFASMLADGRPPQRDEALPTDELSRAFIDSAASLLGAFAKPGALERSYAGPLGSATGSDRLKIRLYDLLAHAWDLAEATGQRLQLPDGASEDALVFVREQLTDGTRTGRFGPPQTVPDDAPAIEHLVAFLGRRVG